MRRAVERFLEDPLAEELLRGTIKGGDVVQVARAGERLVFRTAAPAVDGVPELEDSVDGHR